MSQKQNIVEFQPGDYVVREKSPCDGLYIIQEGQLEVFKTNKDGSKIPTGMINSGEYVGETAVMLDEPHSSNVMALTNVKAIRIPKESIEAQLKNVPSWLIALTKGLIKRLHYANDILKRNGLADDHLVTSVQAVEQRNKDSG